MTRPAPTLAQVEATLPQTQCGRCGFGGCRPYAEALIAGTTTLDRCPPGGTRTRLALSQCLQQPAPDALHPEVGPETPHQVAWVDPDVCIGCGKCLLPCPVDAIVGTFKRMHIVLQDACTGCELCVAPCPMDCIHMHTLPPAAPDTWPAPLGASSQARFEAKNKRLEQQAQAEAQALRACRPADLLQDSLTPPGSVT